jgi:hypothetical protein
VSLNSNYRIFRKAFLVASLGLLSPLSCLATELIQAPGGLADGKNVHFPSVQLRGYGKVSGDFVALGTGGSLLTIHCESADKAGIMQAKYLSDLGLLPGVSSQTITTKGGTITARQVEGQGLITAVRSGSNVFVLAATDASGLITLCDEHLPAEVKIDATDATEKDAGVPMYLDRWDKHGFRYYYAALAMPNDVSAAPGPRTYNSDDDIKFALDEGNCGMVLWQTPFPTEQAEGIMKTPMWEWVVGAAQQDGMPLGINLSMGVPCSLYNRYREDWTVADPQYLGGFYGLLSADEGIFSWNSVAGRDAQLSELQQTIRQFNHVENIVNWLNPDGEMGHGAPDNLINYGPTADAGYRTFLKSKYGTVGAVAARWYGDEKSLGSWDAVHVPELASFLGWGKDAIDLTGMWKVSHDAVPGSETAAENFDDSAWPSMQAPGHAIAILLPRKPGVLRRHVTIDPAWRQAHDHVWLYVLDLSDTRGARYNPAAGTRSFLNGSELEEVRPNQPITESHWAAYDVSSTLKAGDNTVAVDTPQGFFNYRVYFSPHAPRSYPDLGPHLNAQWADFIDGGSWSRANDVRRGSQIIRQADPNRPITFMSPDSYAADIKTVCEDYGGVFHNTGYMAGVWADFLPMEMEASNLPTDEEPGSGAKTLTEFKGFLGRWSTEGIQGVDYFQHIGDVEWKPEIKSYFHDTINLWHLMGKYHVPKAQVALLSSDRVDRLYGFPFHSDRQNDPHGHWDVRFNELLLPYYAREEVFETDFDRGNTDAYKVIIDSNTSVMDPPFIAKIEKWVKAGGIFITWNQTGRNTSIEKDAWPISRLTGYKVNGIADSSRKLQFVDGAPIIKAADWDSKSAFGLTLEKQAPECVDLLKWNDGTTAVGMRPLGKGYIIHLGARLANPDALTFFQSVIDWAKVPRIPATAPGLLMRHYVSNNGLYDIWAMWNDKKTPVSTTLTLTGDPRPHAALDVKTGQSIPLQNGADGVTTPISLDSFETQVLLTPRNAITSAPAEWFALQRNWWRGSGDPGLVLPPFKSRYTVDLQQNWSFKALDGATDGTQGQSLAGTDVDDSSWEKRPLGIFNYGQNPEPRHAIFRKRFTVPANWSAGEVTLWLSEWHGVGYLDNGVAFLDGKEISRKAILGDDVNGALKPGTTHTLAIEIWGNNPVVGTPASIWINYRPDAPEQQNLAGPWAPAADGLTYTNPVTIPGIYQGVTLRKMVTIDASHARETAVIRISARDNSIYGVIVNGIWISRFHHHIGNDFDIAITPFLKMGRDNEIILFGDNGQHALTEVSLNFYRRGTYP